MRIARVAIVLCTVVVDSSYAGHQLVCDSVRKRIHPRTITLPTFMNKTALPVFISHVSMLQSCDCVDSGHRSVATRRVGVHASGSWRALHTYAVWKDNDNGVVILAIGVTAPELRAQLVT
jgi:hypothetical protein